MFLFFRVAGVAPPAPPIVPNPYRPPDDAAHYYYGTRDPLHPNSLQNQGTLVHPPPFIKL